MSQGNESRGRWEFDENGNVRFVQGSDTQSGEQSRQSDFVRQPGPDGTYHYKYNTAQRPQESSGANRPPERSPRKKQDTGWHWIFIILGFMIAWPVGLVALFLELSGKWPSGRQLERGVKKAESFAQEAADKAKKQYHTQQESARQWAAAQQAEARQRAEAQQAEARRRAEAQQRAASQMPPPPVHKGASAQNNEKQNKKRMKKEDTARGLGHVGLFRGIGAAMVGLFGFTFVMELIDQIGYLTTGGWSVQWVLSDTVPLLALALTGVALLCLAGSRDRKSKRFRRYLTAIGKKKQVPVEPLASAMGVSEKKAIRDLQEMLERGYLEEGYLDVARKMLVIGEMEFEVSPEPELVREEPPENESTAAATIRHIQEVNRAIANPELSEKIYRIEELTAKIFQLLEERPEKASELRSFMSYYLPQTLKILENYAQLEAQGVEGENIAEAKQKIEATMDKVVDGYEAQLDKLFADDVLDISADLKVMETMLETDGLTADSELKF